MMEGELKHVSAQSLECPVCLSIFKNPKILSCSHTFYKACLNNLLECHGNHKKLRCPVCRADTQVLNQDVSTLQTNLALKSLIEDVENQQQICTNCNSEEKTQAIVYCQDCCKYLCNTCQIMHSQWGDFRDHIVSTMRDIASGNVSERRYRKCRKHPREDEECFCTNCRKFACFRCGIMAHKDEGHRVIEASVYESNHLKSVEDLKSMADKICSCIQKYIDCIDEQKDIVNTMKKQCTHDISEAFEESILRMTANRDLLLDEVNGRTTKAETKLDKMKKAAQQRITHINTATDLVAHGTKIPLEMDALAAHDTLCQELQDTLTLDDPDYKKPIKTGKKGNCIVFEKAGVDELGLGKIVILASAKTTCAKNIKLSSKNSMNCMVPTPDGRMALGCVGGGIEIFSADGQVQQTVLKNIKIDDVGFLSDGRYVVRDCSNDVTLYTTECEKLDVRFVTLNQGAEGRFGGLCVDSDDQIYVSYTDVRRIQVFLPTGGHTIREIFCHEYEPWQITSYNDVLIVGDVNSTIRMVEKRGSLRCALAKSDGRLHGIAVTRDNSILISWVDHTKGVVSIDEYDNELEHVETIISDYKIEKPGRCWYYIQEFQSGEIAFCTPNRLYIFRSNT